MPTSRYCTGLRTSAHRTSDIDTSGRCPRTILPGHVTTHEGHSGPHHGARCLSRLRHYIGRVLRIDTFVRRPNPCLSQPSCRFRG